MQEHKLRPSSTLVSLAVLALAAPLAAQSQSQASPPAPAPATRPSSLGDVARQAAAARAKSGEKAVKVYTNADLKSVTTGISVVGPPPASSVAEAQEAEGEAATKAKRDEQYYREKSTKLRNALDTHQRELEVLKQKLGINSAQYYSDPNKTLEQEYSRSDINKLTQEIDAKKQQIEADQQALSDLERELRRAGGDPAWLRGGSANSKAASAPAAPEPHTRAEWQQAIQAARSRLARAQEEQQLAENEQSLLESQEARDVTTGNTAEIAAKIADKKTEVESKRAATERAQKELEELERKFEQAGASDAKQ